MSWFHDQVRTFRKTDALGCGSSVFTGADYLDATDRANGLPPRAGNGGSKK